MPRRVCIFGAESTGKSTLARDLACFFDTVWVPEYSRIYSDRKGGDLGPDDAPLIMAGQQASEDVAAAGLPENAFLFCDTDLLSSVIWCDLLYAGCPEKWRGLAEHRARQYELYLLCEPDVPFVPDPQRCFPDPDQRQHAARHWENYLLRLRLPFVKIHGEEWLARFRMAVDAIRKLA